MVHPMLELEETTNTESLPMTRTLNQRSFLTPLRIIRPVLGLPLPVTIPLLTVVLHTLKERIILTEAVVVTITTTIAAVVVVPTSSR